MLRVTCPACATAITVADHLVGRQGVCPACGGPVIYAAESVEGDALEEETAAGEDRPVQFAPIDVPEEVMDMTPMVDVVFQLLIFFMMTAAFSLQKALEMPPPSNQEETAQAQTLEELENEGDFIIVRIDRDNNVTVDGTDAPSEQELLTRLREAKSGGAGQAGPVRTSVLVMADPQCLHETVIRALDAANAVGMERIRLATVEDTAF